MKDPINKVQSPAYEIEKVLIGACLRFPENVPTILNALTVEDFFNRKSKDVFGAIKSLYEKKDPIDPLSVSVELKAKGKEILPSEIVELEDHFIDGLPLEYHVEQLRTFSKRRKLEIALTESLAKVKDLSVEYQELERCVAEEVAAILKDTPVSGKKAALVLPTLSDFFDMDIEVEWVINKLIPKEGITVLHGRGGLGKTWLLLQAGACISDGKPFCGLSTIKEPVYYIDFENPKPELIHRSRVLGRSSLQVWHLSHDPPPPRLDDRQWILYKSLPAGVIIFDSMRSAHLLDENSSKDMTIIMSRLKELRELGHTIIAILHAPKGDSRTYRGSTALIDQCDHALGFEKVKAVGSDTAVDADDENDLPFRLGHIQKTRFTPYKMYLRFDPNEGFLLAPDPQQQTLKAMHQALLNHYRSFGPPAQTKFVDIVKAELDFSKGKIINLIKKGDGTLWRSLVERKFDNRITYTPVFYEGDEHY